jgi:hypothetical protein
MENTFVILGRDNDKLLSPKVFDTFEEAEDYANELFFSWIFRVFQLEKSN